METDILLRVFGWMTLVNGAILVFGTIALSVAREWIMTIHAAMTGVDRVDLPVLYFSYLGNFKIAWIMLNLVPYLVLRLAM